MKKEMIVFFNIYLTTTAFWPGLNSKYLQITNFSVAKVTTSVCNTVENAEKVVTIFCFFHNVFKDKVLRLRVVKLFTVC